jgi:hypothetical protein
VNITFPRRRPLHEFGTLKTVHNRSLRISHGQCTLLKHVKSNDLLRTVITETCNLCQILNQSLCAYHFYILLLILIFLHNCYKGEADLLRCCIRNSSPTVAKLHSSAEFLTQQFCENTSSIVI